LIAPTIRETIRAMGTDREIKLLFSKLESAGPSLLAIAKEMGLGVIETTADDPNKVGILASASKVLAEHRISIRWALVDGPELNPNPKLTLIANRVIPGKTIRLKLKIPGIAKVSVY